MFKHNPNSLGDAHEAITKVSNQLSRGLINPSDAYAQFLRILVDFKMETLHESVMAMSTPTRLTASKPEF